MEPVNLSPTPVQETTEQTSPTEGIGEAYREFKPLYERFGAKEGSESTDRQLKMIWDYAKENAELKDKDSVLWEIRKLEMRLGNPSFGQKPWLNLVSYISTHRQMQASEKRLKEMEAHP